MNSDELGRRLNGCFGIVDGKFAVHSAEEQRAFDLLKDLRDQGIGWSKVKEAVTVYLQDKKAHGAHIEEQMKRVETHFRPWLID